jgi:glutamyl-tRNA synthetase
VDFLFLDEPVEDEASWNKAMKAGAGDIVSDSRAELVGVADWKADDLKAVLLAVGEKHGLKLGKAQAPIRVAVTGRTIGLPLFESLELLGRDRVLARLDAASKKLAAQA